VGYGGSNIIRHEILGRIEKKMHFLPDVYLVLFNVVDRSSFNDVGQVWYREMEVFRQNKPKVLVGAKSDLRRHTNIPHVSHKEARSLARNIGAVAFMECSVTENINVVEVFHTVIMAVILPHAKPHIPVVKENMKPKRRITSILKKKKKKDLNADPIKRKADAIGVPFHEVLPKDLIIEVLSLLPIFEVSVVCSVCKALNKFANDRVLWNNFCIRDLCHQVKHSEDINPKRYYQQHFIWYNDFSIRQLPIPFLQSNGII